MCPDLSQKRGLLVLTALLTLLGCLRQKPADPAPSPTRTLDMATQPGFADAPPGANLALRKIFFLDEDHLAVAFMYDIPSAKTSAWAGSRVVLQRLDLRSGAAPSPAQGMDLPYPTGTTLDLTAAPDGGVYLLAGWQLSRFDTQLHLLAQRDLSKAASEPAPPHRASSVPEEESPQKVLLGKDGSLLVLFSRYHEKGSQLTGRWLAPDTLADLPLPALHRQADSLFLTADDLLWNTAAGAVLQPAHEAVGHFSPGAERPFCSTCSGSEVLAVADSLFLSAESPKNAESMNLPPAKRVTGATLYPVVRRGDGTELWRPEEEEWPLTGPRTATGAAHAPVFAFNVSPGLASTVFSGLSNVYGARGPSRIKVLDAGQRKKLMDFRPVEMDPQSRYPLGLALSPSGRRLAVLSGTVAEIYNIP